MSIKDKVWLDEIIPPIEGGETICTYVFSKRDHGAFLKLYSSVDEASDKIVAILTAFNTQK